MKESKFEKIEIKKEKPGEGEKKELTPEEINEMINEKAIDAYKNNVAVRFTNEVFLNDVFETKKEFKGYGMFLLGYEDRKDHKDYYDKHYQKRWNGFETKNIYEIIPRGKANLGTFIDKVHIKSGWFPEDGKASSKMRSWKEFIQKATDWSSNPSWQYNHELKNIKDIKTKSENKTEFHGRIKKHLTEELKKRFSQSKSPDIEKLLEKIEQSSEESFSKSDILREYLHLVSGLFQPIEDIDSQILKEGKDIFRRFNIGLLTDFDAIESSGWWGRSNWVKFKKPEQIDLQKHLKGIISLIRDRVYEKKLIEEMEKLTEDNPELRVPIFDLDGNQIYPIRKKREEIEEEIKEESKS